MPEGAISVTRPGKWGNPFIVSPTAHPGGRSGVFYICVPTVEDAVECFREMMIIHPETTAQAVAELRGKDLACWCPIGTPCHGDVLLELANKDRVN